MLWFFVGAYRGQRQITPTGAPTEHASDTRNFYGKPTWQATPSHKITGQFLWGNDDHDHYNSGPLTADDATLRRT